VRQRAEPLGIEIQVGDHRAAQFTDRHFGALLQYPGTDGRIDAVIPRATATTLFARFGNVIPLALAGMLILLALLPLARRRASR
jgi:glycine cleavage system pyridoxal-binding protein P